MPDQHTIESQVAADQSVTQAIVVPLDLPELRILKQSLQTDGSIEVHVIATTNRGSCPRCASLCVKIHDTRGRVKRDTSLREHAVRLVLYKRRFRCLSCRRSFTEPDSICGKYKRTTSRWREQLGKAACQQPLAEVAKQAEVGPRFVQDCLQSVIEDRCAKEGRSLDESAPLATPRFVGIDEFARRKGHRYETIFCDLEHRRVLEVSEGRKLEEVVKLLERFTDPDAVQAVSMDMSKSFRSACQLCLPKAQIVVDHFHVMQHVMKAFRKIVSSWAHKKESKALLEGKQQLFLMAAESLTQEQRQEREQIGQALPPLEEAWQIKEALRTWYAQSTAATAAAGLDGWIKRVQESELAPLHRTLSAFRNWRAEILAFFQFLPMRISNGFVEGKNNRTKAIMRQGYGYRNRHHLRLRIFLADLP